MKHAVKLFSYTTFLLFLLNPALAGAFGISPPSINAEILLQGSRFESTIFLVRGDASQDIAVEAIFNVHERIKDWIILDVGEYFIIPAGVQQFPVKVQIQVPEDAEFGIYNGSIAFNTLPVRSEGQQILISVGVGLSLALTVGEGVFPDFNIKHIDILDIKEGELPRAVVTVENTGNVLFGPDRATLDLFDKYGEVRIGFAQNETLSEIPAFETQTFIIEFPINIKLGIGEYWAEVKVYRGGAVVGEIKTVFNVLEKKISLFIWIGLFIILVVLGGFAYKYIRLKRIR